MSSLTAQDRCAIADLYAAYCTTIDAGDVSGWMATWTSDGVFAHPQRDYAGHEALTGFVTTRSAALRAHAIGHQHHWIAHLTIEDEATDGQVTASCALLVSGRVRETGAPTVITAGTYRDTLVQTHGGWRFMRRTLVLD